MLRTGCFHDYKAMESRGLLSGRKRLVHAVTLFVTLSVDSYDFFFQVFTLYERFRTSYFLSIGI